MIISFVDINILFVLINMQILTIHFGILFVSFVSILIILICWNYKYISLCWFALFSCNISGLMRTRHVSKITKSSLKKKKKKLIKMFVQQHLYI